MSELGRPALTLLRSKARSLRPIVLLDSRPIDFTQKQMRSCVTFAQTDWLIVLASSAIDNHHRF
jgi:hypothetical protein